jgi:uncharacterized membrane protein
MVRLDAGVLVLGIVLNLCSFSIDHAGSDESVLTSQAAAEFLHGHLVYGQPWKWLFTGNIAITTTASGGADYTYGYPPLPLMLTAPIYAVIHSAVASIMVAMGALIGGTVALWRMLPAPWRSAATAVCLGFGLISNYARIPVVVRWPATAAGGRLRRPGVLRAICLGAACASQQLAWFLAPFLILGIYCVRRGELGHRPALASVARYTGIALLTWLAINAYFIIQEPAQWLSGVLLPLTQGALIHGQGLVDISFYLTEGSNRLYFYSYGSMLFAAGLLAAMVFFIKRLGPAATVLPWCAFYFATRSQDSYYLLMVPLWLAAAATVPPSAFAGAWQPRIPRLRGRTGRAALAAGLLAPAVTCLVIAATSSPPLKYTIPAVHPQKGIIHNIAFQLTNTSGAALTPNFAISTGQGISLFWRVESGPATLAPHQTARYVISPGSGNYAIPKVHPLRIRLRAFTATPTTISSHDVPVAKQQTVTTKK